MKITYNGNEYDLHWSYRVHYLFEDKAGKTLDKLNGSHDANILFYCVFLATMQYNHVDCDLTEAEFSNWVDDNGNDKLFLDFNNWFYKKMTQQNELSPKKGSKPKKGEEPDPNS